MKENKVRHRLANGKAARKAYPKNLTCGGDCVLDLVNIEYLWKGMIGLFVLFIFLLVILVTDE